MKLYLKVIALLLALIIPTLSLVSCGLFDSTNDIEDEEETPEYNYKPLYNHATSLGYSGSMKDFKSIINKAYGDKIPDDIYISESMTTKNGHLIIILSDGTNIDLGIPTVKDNDNNNDNTNDDTNDNTNTDDNNGGENNGENTGNNGGNSNDDGKVTYYPVVYDGSEVTITFWHTMGQQQRSVLDYHIAEFNKLYPNITIQHEQVGSYNDVRDYTKVALVSGNQPNIVYCYPDHVALYNLTRKVVPLDNFIESTEIVTGANGHIEILGLTDAQIDSFIDGFYEEGRVFDAAGTMYTLPMSKSTEVLYYNKAFFEANNLSVPTTWNELEDLCEIIMEITDGKYAFAYDSEANWFITMTEQYGSEYTSLNGDHFVFNNETNRNFVKRFRTWYDKGYFTTQELYGAYASNLFTSGYCYMVIGSSAGAKHYATGSNDSNVGVAPIPQVDVYNPKAISQGPSLCMFDQQNKQEVAASWLFMKFLTTNLEFQADFSMSSGYMPVIELETLINELPAFGAWLNYSDTVQTRALKVSLEQADAYYVSPAFNGSSQARDQVVELMKYCFTTPAVDIDAMIAEAFAKAIAECEANA